MGSLFQKTAAKSSQTSKSDRQKQTQLIRAHLSRDMARVCEMLGYRKPFRDRHSLRFGSKGSLAVVVSGPDAGQWFNYEDGIGGDPFSLIMHTLGADFKEAREWALNYLGGAVQTLPEQPARHVVSPKRNDSSEGALKLWHSSERYLGTLGEAYLQSRAITARLSHDCVRFNPRTFWRLGDETGYAPALILLVRNMETGALQAVQRRYLDGDGNKHPAFAKAKAYGPTARGAIMLTGHHAAIGLNICEGFEDAASVLCLGLDGGSWAVCGTSGLKNLKPLAHIPAIRIFADDDEAGTLKANECAARWRASGKFADCYTVQTGHDVNGYLMAGGK